MESSSGTLFSTMPQLENRVSPLSLFALYVFLTLVVYLIAVYRRGQRRGGENERSPRPRGNASRNSDDHSKRVLLVIAHPDDECMFFGPSILSLNSNPHTNVHILCLSNGNYYGKGREREKELLASCAILGVPSCCVTILNESELQDGPDEIWNEDIVGKHIYRQIVKCDAHMVLTFDKDGISSHPNHIAAYRGVRKLVIKRELPQGVRAYCLESVTLLRRFISFLEVPMSFVLSAMRGSKVLVSSPHGVLRAQRALKAHATQFVWFRILNMMFSRYYIINTIRTITVKES